MRRGGYRGAGRLGDVRAVEPLLAALATELCGGRLSRRWVWLGTLAVEPLVATVAGTGDVRRAAVEALGRLGDVRAVSRWWQPCVIATRRCGGAGAVEALGRLGDVRAVEPLLAALRDNDRDVRRAAAKALGRLGDVRAVEPLVALLSDSELVCAAGGRRGAGAAG